MIVVSYPNNPVTALATFEFYEKLVAWAKKYDVVVVHDNAYSELVMDEEPGMSFLKVPGALDVGIEFNSLSKSYNPVSYTHLDVYKRQSKKSHG